MEVLGLILRRNSIDHHKSVRVSLNTGPSTGAFSRIDNADILASTCWHTERNMFGIALPGQS